LGDYIINRPLDLKNMLEKFSIKKIINNKEAGAGEKKGLEDVYNADYYKLERPEVKGKPLYLPILLSIFFALAACLIYNFVFNNYIGNLGGDKITIEKNEAITVTSEERVFSLRDEVAPTIINFYDLSGISAGPFYEDKYSLGSGFILTSDGWIVTSKNLIDKIAGKKYALLTNDYKKYEVKKILFDPLSPIAFVKIEAEKLPVAKLGKISAAASGQRVYGFIASYPTPRLASLNLADTARNTLEDVVDSTEKFNGFVSAMEGYDKSLAGAPLINMAGEVLAVVIDGENAVPVEYLKTAISDLSHKEKIDRVYLGVRYITLSKYPRLGGQDINTFNRGALLSGFKNLTAVDRNSPAQKAGLQTGDIITMVEDEIVNGKKNLTQIIQEYDPGQKIELTILRAGEEKKIEVELGKME
jgi:S1-C subfamily serine protease